MANLEVTVAPAAQPLFARTRVVTQTITRPSTTIVAVVTLGDAPQPDPTVTSIIPPPPPPPAATTTTTLAPAPSTSSPLTPQQLGALLGSILGFAFVAFCICCCLTIHRRRLRYYRSRRRGSYSSSSGSSDDMTESEVVRVQTRVYSGGGLNPAWNVPFTGRGGGVTMSSSPTSGTTTTTSGPWTTVPPPVRFPPTTRQAGYSQSREQQIRGVRRFL
ncbi:uncharacterized protein C8A04DRAFT_29196 [Dichotomopilus funicola]|uniref:Uncharacterized protein n=1 Tax=Dichotomopilus funicola TaxID=1934379 RepID=A0AAN6V1L6_9PEZI|nr:hypothetical protein C8A04DRAFT_29196 [Dichotomopilus funicola]